MPRCSAVGSLRLPRRSLSLFHLGMACPVGFCCFGSASLRSFLGALARGLATRHSWCLGQARRPAARCGDGGLLLWLGVGLAVQPAAQRSRPRIHAGLNKTPVRTQQLLVLERTAAS